jgi:hypothetical protein
MGPRAVLDTVVKRKIPSPFQESNPRTPFIQPVAECYTDWAIMTLLVWGNKFYSTEKSILELGMAKAKLQRYRYCSLRHWKLK